MLSKRERAGRGRWLYSAERWNASRLTPPSAQAPAGIEASASMVSTGAGPRWHPAKHHTSPIPSMSNRERQLTAYPFLLKTELLLNRDPELHRSSGQKSASSIPEGAPHCAADRQARPARAHPHIGHRRRTTRRSSPE